MLSVTRFQNVAEVGETGRNWSAIKRRPAKRNDMRDSVYRERKHEELGRELEKKEMAVPDFEADAPTPERSLENYHPFCGPALDSRPVPARFPYFSDVPEIASAKQATVPDVL